MAIEERQATKRMKGLWALIIVMFGVLLFLGDLYYDQSIVPDKAVSQCGEGGVKAVTTRGFYKANITCQ